MLYINFQLPFKFLHKIKCVTFGLGKKVFGIYYKYLWKLYLILKMYLICLISSMKQRKYIYVFTVMHSHLLFFILGKLEIVTMSLLTQHILAAISICVQDIILPLKICKKNKNRSNV